MLWTKVTEKRPPVGITVLMLCNAVPPIRLGYINEDGVWFTDTAQQCFPVYWSLVTVPLEIYEQVVNVETSEC